MEGALVLVDIKNAPWKVLGFQGAYRPGKKITVRRFFAFGVRHRLREIGIGHRLE